MNVKFNHFLQKNPNNTSNCDSCRGDEWVSGDSKYESVSIDKIVGSQSTVAGEDLVNPFIETG